MLINLKHTTQTDILPFISQSNVLSNMHHTDIKYKDISFKSAEHMYQYYKCIQLSQNNLADEVKEASTSMIAKNLASTITDISKWTNHSVPVMRVVYKPKLTLVLSSNQRW